jgi:hypothetical protein
MTILTEGPMAAMDISTHNEELLSVVAIHDMAQLYIFLYQLLC